mmetsp:Transcript_37890/g.57971  ORF Transcript_37890/g.57971 Transcript_37890/m.57971 type:complete len:120 (+) Transcript_37890:628-987(+)
MMFNVNSWKGPFGGRNLEIKKKRRDTFLSALDDMEDIDSDDEDPVVLMEIENIGLKFNVLKVDKNSFLRMFYLMKNLLIEDRFPNLHKYIMNKINEAMDEENAFDKQRNRNITQMSEDR